MEFFYKDFGHTNIIYLLFLSDISSEILCLRRVDMSKLKKIEEKKSFKNKFLENHIIKRLLSFIQSIGEDKVSAYSSEAALFTIISFFPFLMLFLPIWTNCILRRRFHIRRRRIPFP